MAANKVFGWVDKRVSNIPVGGDRRDSKTRRVGDSKIMRQTLDWLYTWRWAPWWVMAFVFGVAILPNWIDKAKFYIRPVAVMEGKLISKTADTARLHIYGTKRRGVECQYLGIQAFGDRLVGLPVDLVIGRVDIPQVGDTKPTGNFDIGVWEIKPTLGVITVRVYVSHDCSGTRVATKIAEVKI